MNRPAEITQLGGQGAGEGVTPCATTQFPQEQTASSMASPSFTSDGAGSSLCGSPPPVGPPPLSSLGSPIHPIGINALHALPMWKTTPDAASPPPSLPQRKFSPAGSMMGSPAPGRSLMAPVLMTQPQCTSSPPAAQMWCAFDPSKVTDDMSYFHKEQMANFRRCAEWTGPRAASAPLGPLNATNSNRSPGPTSHTPPYPHLVGSGAQHLYGGAATAVSGGGPMTASSTTGLRFGQLPPMGAQPEDLLAAHHEEMARLRATVSSPCIHRTTFQQQQERQGREMRQLEMQFDRLHRKLDTEGERLCAQQVREALDCSALDEAERKSKVSVEVLHDTVEELRAEVRRTHRAKEERKRRAKDKEKRVIQRREEVRRRREQQREAEEVATQRCAAAVAEAEQRHRQLQVEQQAREHEVERLKDMMEELRTELLNSEGKNEELEEESQHSLRMAAQKWELEISGYRQQISGLMENITTAREELQRAALAGQHQREEAELRHQREVLAMEGVLDTIREQLNGKKMMQKNQQQEMMLSSRKKAHKRAKRERKKLQAKAKAELRANAKSKLKSKSRSHSGSGRHHSSPKCHHCHCDGEGGCAPVLLDSSAPRVREGEYYASLPQRHVAPDSQELPTLGSVPQRSSLPPAVAQTAPPSGGLTRVPNLTLPATLDGWRSRSGSPSNSNRIGGLGQVALGGAGLSGYSLTGGQATVMSRPAVLEVLPAPLLPPAEGPTSRTPAATSSRRDSTRSAQSITDMRKMIDGLRLQVEEAERSAKREADMASSVEVSRGNPYPSRKDSLLGVPTPLSPPSAMVQGEPSTNVLLQQLQQLLPTLDAMTVHEEELRSAPTSPRFAAAEVEQQIRLGAEEAEEAEMLLQLQSLKSSIREYKSSNEANFKAAQLAFQSAQQTKEFKDMLQQQLIQAGSLTSIPPHSSSVQPMPIMATTTMPTPSANSPRVQFCPTPAPVSVSPSPVAERHNSAGGPSRLPMSLSAPGTNSLAHSTSIPGHVSSTSSLGTPLPQQPSLQHVGHHSLHSSASKYDGMELRSEVLQRVRASPLLHPTSLDTSFQRF